MASTLHVCLTLFSSWRSLFQALPPGRDVCCMNVEAGINKLWAALSWRHTAVHIWSRQALLLQLTGGQFGPPAGSKVRVFLPRISSFNVLKFKLFWKFSSSLSAWIWAEWPKLIFSVEVGLSSWWPSRDFAWELNRFLPLQFVGQERCEEFSLWWRSDLLPAPSRWFLVLRVKRGVSCRLHLISALPFYCFLLHRCTRLQLQS